MAFLKKTFKTFLNDEDGLTITDYLCILITLLYLILVIVTMIFSLCHPKGMFEIRYNALRDLLGILDDPVKILLTAYFINGFAGVVKGNYNSNTQTTDETISTNDKNVTQ